MASRAVGALFGLAAVILFAVSIASPRVTPKLPAWWDGHPEVDGKTYDRMDVHVGLAGASRCFDGDANCSGLDVDSTFEMVALGELGVAGLAFVFAVLLTVSIWRIGDGRKTLARLAMGVAVIAGAGSAALVLIGPDLHASDQGRVLGIAVPLGPGLFMFWGALVATFVSAISALRVQPEPLRLRPSLARPPDAVQPDLRDVMREPQLRPLYDVQGAAPIAPPVQMPSRAPTPMPRESIRALAGLDTPPPAPPPPRAGLEHAAAPRRNSDRAESQPIDPPPPPPPPLRVPTMPDGPLRPKTQQPPRAKAPSAAPPPRPSQPQIGRKTPPLGDKPLNKVGRKSEPAIPERVPEKKTIAHAIPPPPTADEPRAPTTLAAKDARLSTEVDGRLETGMRETEAITAVEIDAEAKAAFVASERQRKVAERHAAETAQMIDGSDTGVEVSPPTRPASTTAASEIGDHTDEVQQRAESLSERAATTAAPAPAPAPSPAPAHAPAPAPAHAPAPAPAPAEPPRAATQIPISTAPTSLPPPKAAPSVPTGPTPACPQCEAPMAWVEEHLRFYCKQCRMYF